jgi:membrane-associated PAP2 superfamily phosphatase
MADKRISDNPPVYVIKASLVQWLIFGSIMYAIMSMSAMKEQFAVDMEVQQRLFKEAQKSYLEEQHNTMYEILASKLKELRVSFDESNKLTETMCKP